MGFSLLFELFMRGFKQDSFSMNITRFLFISLLACFLVKADVNPCDDFYAFACEDFIKNTPIPEGEEFVTQRSLLDVGLFDKLKGVLSEENPQDSNIDKLPKIFYRSCVQNESSIEELQRILEDLHGFPVNSQLDETSYNWMETLYRMKDLGLPTDILFLIKVDNYKGVTDIRIDRPNMKSYISNDTEENPQTAAYYKYMVDAAELLGADRQTAEADMMDVLMFENEIEKIKSTSNNFEPPSLQISTLGELADLEPRFPWLEYINRIVPGNEYINETQRVDASIPNYYTGIMNLIQQTDGRTLANFIDWKFVDFAFEYLNEDLKELKPDFETNRELPSFETEDRCVIFVLIKFPEIITTLYLKKYFTKADQQVVVEMVETMRGEVEQMLDEIEWMDEESKEEAQRKLEHLKTEIGYPEEQLQEDIIASKYEQLTLIPGSFLQITLNVSKFLQDLHFSRLYLPNITENEDMFMVQGVLLTISYYYTRDNIIGIAAGLLQPPIFNRSSSEEVNYGSAGFAIAREFNYVFSQRGSSHNYLGEYDNWWTTATKEGFGEISECAVNAYDDLVTEYQDEEQINAQNYLEAILADLSGARIAYRAYLKTSEELQEEEHAKEGHSSKQLFWLSLANFHCAKNDLPMMQERNIFSLFPHLPGKTRMNGIAMNNEDFARDWNCESGSPMNPQEKCQAW